jgi:hypothetical protein
MFNDVKTICDRMTNGTFPTYAPPKEQVGPANNTLPKNLMQGKKVRTVA